MTSAIPYRINKYLVGVIFFYLLVNTVILSQELEPRIITNIPVGTNFVGMGYAYGFGNLLLDPTLPIEDLKASLNTVVGSYVHAFNFFGKSAKVDVVIPWAYGNWDGVLDGVDTSTWRMGMGDPRVRLWVNLLGAPATKASEYSNYDQKTIVGLSLQVIDPLGTYYPDKLINLGSNRWTFRPQIGVSHKLNRWVFEAYTGLWIFTHNPNFLNGNRLTQKPLFTAKFHAIHTFPNKTWGAVGIGYGYGGNTAVNSVPHNFTISTYRIQAVFVVPLKERQSVMFRYDTGVRIKQGADFDAVTVAYQLRWLPDMKKKSKKEKKKKKPKTEEEFYLNI